jgi:hypothetical protein
MAPRLRAEMREISPKVQDFQSIPKAIAARQAIMTIVKVREFAIHADISVNPSGWQEAGIPVEIMNVL